MASNILTHNRSSDAGNAKKGRFSKFRKRRANKPLVSQPVRDLDVADVPTFKPPAKDYLEEIKARRLRQQLRRSQILNEQDTTSSSLEPAKALDSSRGHSAGSNSSKDEGIYSTNEREDDADQDESSHDPDTDAEPEQDEQDKNEEDEGQGSLHETELAGMDAADEAANDEGYQGDLESSSGSAALVDLSDDVNEQEAEGSEKNEELENENVETEGEPTAVEEAQPDLGPTDETAQVLNELEEDADQDEIPAETDDAEVPADVEEPIEVEENEDKEMSPGAEEATDVEETGEEEMPHEADEFVEVEESNEEEMQTEAEVLSEETQDIENQEEESPEDGSTIENEIPQEERVETAAESVPEILAVAKIPGTKRRPKKSFTSQEEQSSPKQKSLFNRLYSEAFAKRGLKQANGPQPTIEPKLKRVKRKAKQHGEAETKYVVGDENLPLLLEANEAPVDSDIPQLKLDILETLETESPSFTENASSEEIRLNPYMDHNLKRPTAPHKKKKSTPSTPGEVHPNPGGESEVWIPDEDKLYVYSYSSQPRLLHIKRTANGGVATSDVWNPNSSFRLQRRTPGRAAFGREGAPKWNPYFANARSLSRTDFQIFDTDEMKQKRDDFRRRLEERGRYRGGMASLYASSVNAHNRHRVNAHSQTNNPYEPLDASQGSNSSTQTKWGTSSTRSMGSYRIPRQSVKPGVSVGTQVYEDELEIVRTPEDAAVWSLVGSTLREAALEVAAEEETSRRRAARGAASRFPNFGMVPDGEEELNPLEMTDVAQTAIEVGNSPFEENAAEEEGAADPFEELVMEDPAEEEATEDANAEEEAEDPDAEEETEDPPAEENTGEEDQGDALLEEEA